MPQTGLEFARKLVFYISICKCVFLCVSRGLCARSVPCPSGSQRSVPGMVPPVALRRERSAGTHLILDSFAPAAEESAGTLLWAPLESGHWKATWFLIIQINLVLPGF